MLKYKMNIGVMQGSLLPKEDANSIQGFHSNWKKEFQIAENHKIPHIEWIITEKSCETNPMVKAHQREFPLPSQTGVRISGIRLDALNSEKFVNSDYRMSVMFAGISATLSRRDYLHIDQIILPLLENSSIKNDNIRESFLEDLTSIMTMYPALTFSIETDLDVDVLSQILERFSKLKVTFNTGNLTRMGYDLKHHIDAYRNKINNVHISDCKVGSSDVALGSGDVDFTSLPCLLKDCRVNFITLQTTQNDNISEIELYDKNCEFIAKICKELLPE